MTAGFPEGAWDGHAHVIGERGRYPLADGRDYDPDEASLDRYLQLLDRLGLARGVLVQPSVYGFDNRCLLDALDRADGRLVGVAVPRPDATPGDLEAMHRRGVRGVRLNLLNSGGLAPGDVLAWRGVLRDLGWHVGLHADLTQPAGSAGAGPGTFDPAAPAPPPLDLAALVDRLQVPVVVDHMGRPPPGRADPAAPGLQRLADLVRRGVCFVKLSAPYRLSAAGPPWRDVAPLARSLLAARPEACVWATDWPHVDTPVPVRTGDLLEALGDWCPEADRRRALMVETAEALFGDPLHPCATHER